jgi:hypothetical protein
MLTNSSNVASLDNCASFASSEKPPQWTGLVGPGKKQFGDWARMNSAMKDAAEKPLSSNPQQASYRGSPKNTFFVSAQMKHILFWNT